MYKFKDVLAKLVGAELLAFRGGSLDCQ
jgi:hypothetical protein